MASYLQDSNDLILPTVSLERLVKDRNSYSPLASCQLFTMEIEYPGLESRSHKGQVVDSTIQIATSLSAPRHCEVGGEPHARTLLNFEDRINT